MPWFHPDKTQCFPSGAICFIPKSNLSKVGLNMHWKVAVVDLIYESMPCQVLPISMRKTEGNGNAHDAGLVKDSPMRELVRNLERNGWSWNCQWSMIMVLLFQGENFGEAVAFWMQPQGLKGNRLIREWKRINRCHIIARSSGINHFLNRAVPIATSSDGNSILLSILGNCRYI